MREEEQLYVKSGSGRNTRYHPVARFDGFPSDGIWMVESTPGRIRAGRILPAEEVRAEKLGELPAPFVRDRISLERRMDEVCAEIERLRSLGSLGAVSNMELAKAIFDILAKEPEDVE